MTETDRQTGSRVVDLGGTLIGRVTGEIGDRFIELDHEDGQTWLLPDDLLETDGDGILRIRITAGQREALELVRTPPGVESSSGGSAAGGRR